jgi:small multidrug resistance pump
MSLATSYGFLILAVLLGVTSNSFAKSAEGFYPSLSKYHHWYYNCCMYVCTFNGDEKYSNGNNLCFLCGLTIIATVVVGIFRFDQMPNLYSIIGLAFIIVGVLMVNLLGNN